MTRPLPLLLLITVACAGASCGAPDGAPPATPRGLPASSAGNDAAASGGSARPGTSSRSPVSAGGPPAVDVMHGTEVSDPHRWLEGNGEDVKRWSAEQTARATADLRATPGFDQLRARVRELRSAAARTYGLKQRGRRLFAMRFAPPRQQPDLVVLKSLDDTAPRTLVDVMALDPTGKTTIDFFEPSADGQRVAVSMSRAGAEDGDVHVFDVATRRKLPDTLPHVELAGPGGAVAWDPAGAGLFYSHHGCEGDPAPDARSFCTTIYHHTLGAPLASDTRSFTEPLPRIAEVDFISRDDGKYVVAQVQTGDGRDYGYWITSAKKPGWQPVAPFGSGVMDVTFGPADTLLLLATKDAPRGRVVRTRADAPSLEGAEPVIAEGDGGIQNVLAVGDRIFVSENVGMPMRLRIYDAKGKLSATPALPELASLGPLEAIGGEVVTSVMTYTEPATYVRVSGKGTVTRTKLGTEGRVDLSELEVTRDECTSRDGTKVDLHVLHRRGAPRDGNAPTVLTGYGGFGLARTPAFSPLARMHLDAGVVTAVAGIRGGGEHGEGWHQAGMVTRKQNVFDDFLACAQRLVEMTVTQPKRLGILGGSNGGLLVGAALTQQPTAFRAAVALVGIFDSLRSEQTTNGQFNTTEYGTVSDKAQFEALHAYSPYHRVRAGTEYPAVLLTAGENDGRVAAWHARKFAAALQASGTRSPVLLLARGDVGHGVGASLTEVIDDNATTWAFLYRELGVDLRAVAGTPVEHEGRRGR